MNQSTKLKIIFLGCTAFSAEMLSTLIDIESVEVKAIFSIPQEFNISYSREKVKNINYSDLSSFAADLKIPFYEIDSVKGQRLSNFKNIIEEINPDVILVLGWYYKVPQSIRELARLGAWGIHASLLPNYAGGAPLVWAIIEGEKEAGVTLFRLEEGVDDGDIISQEAFPIEDNDTIKEVYDKATIASQKILRNILSDPDRITFNPQNKSEIKVYPQRNPDDGKIDWDWDNIRIKNFIRAQTKPYPGAWTEINGKKIILWDADIIETKNSNI